MRNGTPTICALARALRMLEATIVDGGRNSVSELARAGGIPIATAHRQIATLTNEGFLRRAGHGRHIAGPRLLGLLHHIDEKQILAEVAEPILERLAEQVGLVVQLGTLEHDMVTYRIKTGLQGGALFTKVGMQLEAYCSGIGKALLANLPAEDREAYLASGPFVALTDRTIIAPADLRTELADTRTRGYAIDDGEIVDDLVCCAVPLHTPTGAVPAAISISKLVVGDERRPHMNALVQLLKDAALAIEEAAFGTAKVPTNHVRPEPDDR